MKLIGIDVGGTFTDVIVTDTQRSTTFTFKVPSTPDDPSVAVMRGIAQICERNGVEPAQIDHVFHGTTVATNAILQHRGARTGLITTHGFRDVLHIGRHQRPQHYSIRQRIPWQDRPLVLRRHRKTVTERIAPPNGEVLTPLDEQEVERAARELRDASIESIAICFLFSYLNPVHEKRAKALVESVCPDAYVATSHEVCPQFREFERFTTTAMNAFIGPLVRTYVTRLEAALRATGMKAELHIMCSNGGVATARTIAERPVLTLMSGLAGGLLGAAWVGQRLGRDNLISLDIGGTSADIGVITAGRYAEAAARDTFVAGFPVLSPMIDLHTIGAGGGSIAAVNEAGAFTVGPQSAGAQPGPAAYGLGGDQPTVTDANIVLGRLDLDNFLGGEMELKAPAARAVIESLARKLRLSVEEAAEGTVSVLNANMANAIRARTVQKGIDPREYCLVVSGGAGPLLGAEVARELSIAEVLVPAFPGINSALGLLTSDLKYDLVRTTFQRSTGFDYQALNQYLSEMETTLAEQLTRDGIDAEGATYRRVGDMRYVGQGYELRVELAAGRLSEPGMQQALARFHQQHQREYGHAFASAPVELVNLRVTAIGAIPKIESLPSPQHGSLKAALVKTQPGTFRVGGQLVTADTAFYRRSQLPVGETIAGPAVILQPDSTTVVPPDSTFRVVPSGELIIQVGSRAH
jgi:N-methylhydantoinase A